MQPITEILNVLKTKFSDAYVLASNGDVVVETAGRKRGSRASATILCEAEARAEARQITGDISDEERGALAGLMLFFDFQHRLGAALEEQAILAEIEAEIAAEEAVVEEEAEAIEAEEETLLDPGVAPEHTGKLSTLKPLGYMPLRYFESQGVETIPALIERLSNGGAATDPPLWVSHACQALFTYSGGDATWLDRASAAREASWSEPGVSVLDPGQFHGADGAEEAHLKAKAAMTRKLGPVARFMVDGRTYARNLDQGTAAEVHQLQADITNKWGEILASVAFTTLKVSWA